MNNIRRFHIILLLSSFFNIPATGQGISLSHGCTTSIKVITRSNAIPTEHAINASIEAMKIENNSQGLLAAANNSSVTNNLFSFNQRLNIFLGPNSLPNFKEDQYGNGTHPPIPRNYAHKERVANGLLIVGGVCLLTGLTLMAVGFDDTKTTSDDAAIASAFGGIALTGAGLGMGIPGLHMKIKYHRKRLESKE